jgi:ribosomal protein L35AE/L33A
MSQLKLDQILAPLRYTGSRLIVTGSDFLVSGSDVFGNNLSQSHEFTGSVRITGSLWINNFPIIVSSQTSSMTVLSSSYAISSSYSVLAQNAQDILVYVKNVTGEQIDKGKVVRISGATGDNALISLADWIDDANSANTLGLTTTNIPNDTFGYVMTEGTLLGIDTTNYTPGQLLFLSASGSMTGSAPLAPLHAVRLGQVLRVQQNNGSVYVRIDNGYEIDELHDVRITNAISGQVLVRSGSIWVNGNLESSSFAATASFAPAYVLSSTTASMLESYVLSSQTSSMTVLSASFASTASHAPAYVLNSTSASMLAPYVLTSSTSSMTVLSASFAVTSSFAINTPYYKIGVSGSTSYTVTHNLNEEYPIVQIYDAVDKEQIIPTTIRSINTNQIFIIIGFLFSGSIVVKK